MSVSAQDVELPIGREQYIAAINMLADAPPLSLILPTLFQSGASSSLFSALLSCSSCGAHGNPRKCHGWTVSDEGDEAILIGIWCDECQSVTGLTFRFDGSKFSGIPVKESARFWRRLHAYGLEGSGRRAAEALRPWWDLAGRLEDGLRRLVV